MQHIVPTILAALGVYLALGALFTLAFLALGVTRVDPVVSRSPKRVRFLLAPGCLALWPLLALKWARAPRTTETPS